MGTHEYAWVRQSDTLPFDPENDPNWSVDEATLEKKRVTVGDLNFPPARKEKSFEEAKTAMEEIAYRADDSCGDALLSDDEDDKSSEPPPSIFQQWVSGDYGSPGSDHPKGYVEDGDNEGEMLLACSGEFKMFDRLKKDGFVNVMCPKAPGSRRGGGGAKRKQGGQSNSDRKPSASGGSDSRANLPGRGNATGKSSSRSPAAISERAMKAKAARLKAKETDKSVKSFMSLLQGGDIVKGFENINMRVYATPTTMGSGLIGTSLALRGFAGSLDIRDEVKTTKSEHAARENDTDDSSINFYNLMLSRARLLPSREARMEAYSRIQAALNGEANICKRMMPANPSPSLVTSSTITSTSGNAGAFDVTLGKRTKGESGNGDSAIVTGEDGVEGGGGIRKKVKTEATGAVSSSSGVIYSGDNIREDPHAAAQRGLSVVTGNSII